MDISTIVSLIIVVGLAIVMIYKIFTDKQDASRVLLSLVLEAERRWSDTSGQGAVKREYVIGQIRAWMPIWIRPFFSERVIDVMIDDALKFMKRQLQESAEQAKLE